MTETEKKEVLEMLLLFEQLDEHGKTQVLTYINAYCDGKRAGERKVSA